MEEALRVRIGQDSEAVDMFNQYHLVDLIGGGEIHSLSLVALTSADRKTDNLRHASHQLMWKLISG